MDISFILWIRSQYIFSLFFFFFAQNDVTFGLFQLKPRSSRHVHILFWSLSNFLALKEILSSFCNFVILKWEFLLFSFKIKTIFMQLIKMTGIYKSQIIILEEKWFNLHTEERWKVVREKEGRKIQKSNVNDT